MVKLSNVCEKENDAAKPDTFSDGSLQIDDIFAQAIESWQCLKEYR